PSCIVSPESQAETKPDEAQSSDRLGPTGEAEQDVRGGLYEPEDFRFVTTVKDDGEDKAGGWQVASNVSKFTARVSGNPVPIYTWECRLIVEMPLRSEKRGRIPPDRAATIAATVANDVALPLLSSRSWVGQGVLFCQDLKAGMNTMFKSQLYEGFGAR